MHAFDVINTYFDARTLGALQLFCGLICMDSFLLYLVLLLNALTSNMLLQVTRSACAAHTPSTSATALGQQGSMESTAPRYPTSRSTHSSFSPRQGTAGYSLRSTGELLVALMLQVEMNRCSTQCIVSSLGCMIQGMLCHKQSRSIKQYWHRSLTAHWHYGLWWVHIHIFDRMANA